MVFLLLVSKPISWSITQVPPGSDKPVADLAWSETATAGHLCWHHACELRMQLLQHRHTHSFGLLLVDEISIFIRERLIFLFLVVFKPLSEKTAYFPAVRGGYLWFDEDVCVAAAVNICLCQVSSRTARDRAVSRRWWLGRGLDWSWSTRFPLPNTGARTAVSQSVLHGEWWPESIRDLQPWEVTRQKWGPWSILMVAPRGCWILIRENSECW